MIDEECMMQSSSIAIMRRKKITRKFWMEMRIREIYLCLMGRLDVINIQCLNCLIFSVLIYNVYKLEEALPSKVIHVPAKPVPHLSCVFEDDNCEIEMDSIPKTA